MCHLIGYKIISQIYLWVHISIRNFKLWYSYNIAVQLQDQTTYTAGQNEQIHEGCTYRISVSEYEQWDTTVYMYVLLHSAHLHAEE